MKFDISHRNSFGEEATVSSAASLVRAFRDHDCAVDQLGKMFRVTHRGSNCFFHASDTSFTSVLATKIWNNKMISRKILRDAGIVIPRGRAFGRNEMGQAQRFAERLGNAVVKPVDGTKGRGVSIDVRPDDFEDAWTTARDTSKGRILVESSFENGHEARYLVVDNVCVAVAFRFPPQVCGDGTSTLAQLVDMENRTKITLNPSRADSLIQLDRHRCNLLAARELSPQSILEMGQVLVLDRKANLSTGGFSFEDAERVHADFKELAEQVSRTVPGSHVLGVDIIAKDHDAAPAPENYVVLEANTLPGLRSHMYPDYGTPVDVAAAIAGSCLEKMGVPDAKERFHNHSSVDPTAGPIFPRRLKKNANARIIP